MCNDDEKFTPFENKMLDSIASDKVLISNLGKKNKELQNTIDSLFSLLNDSIATNDRLKSDVQFYQTLSIGCFLAFILSLIMMVVL